MTNEIYAFLKQFKKSKTELKKYTAIANLLEFDDLDIIIDDLIEIINSKNSARIRGTAILLLSRTTNEKKNVPLLLKLLNSDEDEGIRRSAVIALIRLGEMTEKAVPELRKILIKEKSPKVRTSIAFLLREIKTKESIAVLKESIKLESDLNIKFYFVQALAEIEGLDGDSINQLFQIKEKIDLTDSQEWYFDNLLKKLIIKNKLEIFRKEIDKIHDDKQKENLLNSFTMMHDSIINLFLKDVNAMIIGEKPIDVDKIEKYSEIESIRIKAKSGIDDIEIKKAQTESVILEMQLKKALAEAEQAEAWVKVEKEKAELELKLLDVKFKRKRIFSWILDNFTTILNLILTAIVAVLVALIEK